MILLNNELYTPVDNKSDDKGDEYLDLEVEELWRMESERMEEIEMYQKNDKKNNMSSIYKRTIKYKKTIHDLSVIEIWMFHMVRSTRHCKLKLQNRVVSC